MAKFYDTLLWEYIKNPWYKGLSLDLLAVRYFDYKMISYDDVTWKWKINFREVNLQNAANYSAEDVYVTAKLYEKQADIRNDKVLKDIEIPLIEVLKSMEISGVKIDKEKLKEIWEKLKIDAENSEKKIYELAWCEFNIKSPKQVWEILFDKLWLPASKKTKTGYSVDNEVLESLAFKYDIAKYLVEYRQATKLLSTYIEWLTKLIDKNWKIHTSYNQAVAATWRLSSTNPNLQNIPVWAWIWWEIRWAFIPFEKDDLILAADYSQIEVRLLAVLSNDENLLWAFEQNLDIHLETAYFIFWKDEISKDERKIAKSVNFWVIYGISPFWLSKMIWISQAEARLYIDKFYEKYPKVLDYFTKTIEWCREKWYVETMFWRKRYIPSINDSNAIIKKAAEREAINMPIQWSNADIIKIAMIKLQKFIKEKWLKSELIMQVHDELVFNVKKEELDLLKSEIQNIMENIIKAPIKLVVDINV